MDRQDKNEMRVDNLTELIFRNDLLLEPIVTSAIYNADGTLDEQTLKSVRLISKSWKSMVTRILRKNSLPLFLFELTKENSTANTEHVQQHGKLLDIFVASTGEEEEAPTFDLTISSYFFRAQNHQALSNCLVKCGRSLLELNVTIPERGGSLKCVFPSFSLPNLKELTVKLSSDALEFGEQEGPCSTDNITHFVNALLNGSVNLEELSVPFSNFAHAGWLDFKLLTLPATLTTVTLLCALTNGDLEVLIRNPLPRLSSLQLLVKQVPFRDGLLRQVIENLKDSLKELILVHEKYMGPPRRLTSIGFPVMKELRHIRITTMNLQIDSFPVQSSLTSCLPNLKSLGLINQTPQNFHRWMRAENKFASVKVLEIKLADENEQEVEPIDFVINLDEQLMERVAKTFPNVSHLDITLRGTDSGALIVIFLEMRQLEELMIDIVGIDLDAGPDRMDSVLIGAPVGLVSALREYPEFWNNIEFNNAFPSIRNLQGLRYLEMGTSSGDFGAPLISDMTFQFSFLKMATLQVLCLEDRFEASDEMITEWRRQGRVIHDPIIDN